MVNTKSELFLASLLRKPEEDPLASPPIQQPAAWTPRPRAFFRGLGGPVEPPAPAEAAVLPAGGELFEGQDGDVFQSLHPGWPRSPGGVGVV